MAKKVSLEAVLALEMLGFLTRARELKAECDGLPEGDDRRVVRELTIREYLAAVERFSAALAGR
jgi:hypothetical protein